MKILAKTTGPTLVCMSGDFLDAYKLRIVEYDNQVRGWNNRNLLEISLFVEENVSNKDLEELGVEEFIKKYSKKKSTQEVVEEPVLESAGKSEEENSEVVEDEVINKKAKNKGKRKS